MNDISICTVCMNRNEYLEISLHNWIMHPIDKILIVDWSSKSPVKDIVDRYQNGNIILAVVEGKETFNKSKSSNLAHRLNKFAGSKYLLGIDSDILLNLGFFDKYTIDESSVINGFTPPAFGTFGTNLTSYDNFKKVNGYNELMDGWGEEDIDFYDRLKIAGITRKHFVDMIYHLEHSDDKRTENQTEKNKLMSRVKNQLIKNNHAWGINDIQEPQKCKLYIPGREVSEEII